MAMMHFAEGADAESFEVVAAEAGEFAEKPAEVIALAAVGESIGGEGGDEFSQGKRGHGGEPVGDGHDSRLLGEVIGVACDSAHPFTGFLVLLPFDKPALAPFAEVLLGDGLAVEVALENEIHLGPTVEPFDEGCALFPVIEAAVELFADGAWKTSDLAVAHHWEVES